LVTFVDYLSTGAACIAVRCLSVNSESILTARLKRNTSGVGYDSLASIYTQDLQTKIDGQEKHRLSIRKTSTELADHLAEFNDSDMESLFNSLSNTSVWNSLSQLHWTASTLSVTYGWRGMKA